MHCYRKVTDDLIWVGANDRRLAMFEGVYSVPQGVAYNSYLLLDERTVLFDTVDKAVKHRFLENVQAALGNRELDYLVLQHMEPDHSIAVKDLVQLYPSMQIVANEKTAQYLKQFYDLDIDDRLYLVKEAATLKIGKHSLYFIMAPMVHWPEVMVTYDVSDKILFSADAFGSFGALNGALFADEVDFEKDYLDEARRYYCNIVGKYGTQVTTLLNKLRNVEVKMICPLHGFVWRNKLQTIIAKYQLWASYSPEEAGVMIAYASVYGNTENAVEILACRLREMGVKTALYDISVTPISEIIAAAFRWSHLVFAATTYNAGIFVSMEELINDLVAHNIQQRSVVIIENGTWAATSGKLIKEKLMKCQKMNFLAETLSIVSSVKQEQMQDINNLATLIQLSLNDNKKEENPVDVKALAKTANVDIQALFKLSYGLFVLSAKEKEKDNGCIVNTVTQITEQPLQISVAVNKNNLTHDMIKNTKKFNVSVLTENTPFSLVEKFGFHSGKETNKFNDLEELRTKNGICFLKDYVNAVLAATVIEIHDYQTHSVFVAEVDQAFSLSKDPSVTYQYYFDHIKPQPAPGAKTKKGFVCRICGYIYEGESLPPDFICPLCKHGVEAFAAL